MHEQRQALIVVLNLYKKGSMPRTNAVTLIEALFQKEGGSTRYPGLPMTVLKDIGPATAPASNEIKLASEAEDVDINP